MEDTLYKIIDQMTADERSAYARDLIHFIRSTGVSDDITANTLKKSQHTIAAYAASDDAKAKRIPSAETVRQLLELAENQLILKHSDLARLKSRSQIFGEAA